MQTMSNIAELALRGLRDVTDSIEPKTQAPSIVGQLFMHFHGSYGNLFSSKFATGQLNDQGLDKGILSARMVWANALAKFAPDIVMQAAERCKTLHKDFPPNLHQFLEICEACQPRAAYKPPEQAAQIGMSEDLRSAYSKRAREAAMAKIQRIDDAKHGHVETSDGLPGLIQLCAKAMALAGHDEARALFLIERRLVGA
jgi:hypothetical protein